MKVNRFIVAILAFLYISIVGFGAGITVSGDPGSAFRPWSPSMFANGTSLDGVGHGIVDVLEGTGSHVLDPFSPNIPAGHLFLFCKADGTPDYNVTLNAGGLPILTTAISRDAGYKDGVGWAQANTAVLLDIIQPNDPVGTFNIFTPSGDFNLAVKSQDGNFYSQVFLNGPLHPGQSIALFMDDRYPNKVFAGTEDLNPAVPGEGVPGGGIYGDFNDVVVEMHVVPEVPAYASIALLVGAILYTARFKIRSS